VSIKLTVNGAAREPDIDPDMQLLWAIRDHVELTGTKFAAAWRYAVPAPCTSMAGRHARA
jgi:isoquinoline 1-oxidoreductase alpha subunit